MVPSEAAVKETPTEGDSATVVNDFSIQVATVNGSGKPDSQPGVAAVHLWNGNSCIREEYVSVKYRWIAHMVHHPGE